jgi:hypothetical protein
VQVGTSFIDITVKLNEAPQPPAADGVTVYDVDCVVAEVGVPLTTPVEVLIETPAGNEPALTV